jgi:hypothetical protein
MLCLSTCAGARVLRASGWPQSCMCATARRGYAQRVSCDVSMPRRSGPGCRTAHVKRDLAEYVPLLSHDLRHLWPCQFQVEHLAARGHTNLRMERRRRPPGAFADCTQRRVSMRQYSYMHSSMQTHATEGPANGLSANTRLHREQKAHALLRDQLIVSCAVALGCARLFEALRLR